MPTRPMMPESDFNGGIHMSEILFIQRYAEQWRGRLGHQSFEFPPNIASARDALAFGRTNHPRALIAFAGPPLRGSTCQVRKAS